MQMGREQSLSMPTFQLFKEVDGLVLEQINPNDGITRRNSGSLSGRTVSKEGVAVDITGRMKQADGNATNTINGMNRHVSFLNLNSFSTNNHVYFPSYEIKN